MRKLVKQGVALRDEWGYKEIPLHKLREMVDALIEKYGPDATWETSIDYDCLDISLTFMRPETDYELEFRLQKEAAKSIQRDLYEQAMAKLTPRERWAVENKL